VRRVRFFANEGLRTAGLTASNLMKAERSSMTQFDSEASGRSMDDKERHAYREGTLLMPRAAMPKA